MTIQHTVKVEMKSDKELVWQCIMNSAVLFPVALPKEYKKITVIKGNGNCAGSFRVTYFADWWDVKSAMEEIKEVDEGNKKVKCELIGGDLRNYYKSFATTLQVSPCSNKDKNGEPLNTLIEWSATAEKSNTVIPYPNFPEQIIKKTFEDLDAFLNGNN